MGFYVLGLFLSAPVVKFSPSAILSVQSSTRELSNVLKMVKNITERK